MNWPKVLVVEDSDDDYEVVEEAAARRTPVPQLLRAYSSEQAQRMLDAWPDGPDAVRLVLLDQSLPGQNGSDWLRMLRDVPRWRALPVVMFTGSTREADQAACHAAGAQEFHMKVLDARQNLRTLEQVFDRWLGPKIAMTPLRVLIADDSADDRFECRAALLKGSARRYEFSEAQLGHEVEAALAAQPQPDCVLLDYHLPDIDAPELLRRMLPSGEGLIPVPVVIITGSDMVDDGRLLITAGAMDFVGKDWLTPASLTRAVENALERHALRRSHQLALNQAQRSEDRLRLALEAAAAGVWDYHLDTDQWHWSHETSQLAGLPYGEGPYTESDWTRPILPEDLPLMRRALEQARSGEQPEFRAEFRVSHPQRGEVWLLALGRLQSHRDGSPSGLSGIILQVTERRRAEDALRDEHQRKDEFLAMLAHELRNPLAAIASVSQLLHITYAGPDSGQVALQVLERQVRHLSRLVDDLMDASRIARGRVDLRLEALEIGAMVDEAIETVQPLLVEKLHSLSLTKPPGARYVHGDRVRLVQCVANLLHNAAKYTQPRGAIGVEIRDEPCGGAPGVRIEVSDNGLGIAPALLLTVFELFRQGERTLDRAQGGLGIGLSVVQHLVVMHGGIVTASSAGEGRGASFAICLPLVEAPLSQQATPPLSSGAVPRHILVVDDNVDGAEVMAMLLESWGHHVHVSHDALHALDAAQRLRPDLMLLDIGLPGLNGYAVARRLRGMPELEGMRLVALTGYGQPEDLRLAHDAGFDDHLLKPVDLARLGHIIESISPAREP